MSENTQDTGFWSIKKFLFKEEFLEQRVDKAPKKEDIFKDNNPNNSDKSDKESSRIAKPIQVPTQIPTEVNKGDSKDLMDKIYAALQKMNLPGIDFLEVWDSMEAMGGVNDVNLKNSFVALKIASGNTLTKELIIETGNKYLNIISGQLQSDITSKELEMNVLNEELKSKKNDLEKKKSHLTEQIKLLTQELQVVENNLSNIDGTYTSKFENIQSKIGTGKQAQLMITNEINLILTLVQQTL